MQTVKQTIYDIADHLPEQATFDDAMYALYVRQKLEEGLRDLDRGPHLHARGGGTTVIGQAPLMKVIWSRRALPDV